MGARERRKRTAAWKVVGTRIKSSRLRLPKIYRTVGGSGRAGHQKQDQRDFLYIAIAVVIPNDCFDFRIR